MKFPNAVHGSDVTDKPGEPLAAIVDREAAKTLVVRRRDRVGVRYARTLLCVAISFTGCTVISGQTAQVDSKHAALMEMQISSLIKLANVGSVDAEISLGERYLTGSGCKKDPAIAAMWWRKAASKGNVQAYNLLGKLYESEALGKPDYAESLYWYGMSSQASPPVQKTSASSGYSDVLDQVSASLSVAVPTSTVPIQPAVQPTPADNSSAPKTPTAPPITEVHSPSPPPPPPPDDDEKAEKIADLQRQYQDLEDDANIIENSVEQYGQCTGMFSAICDAHNAKELRKAKEDRQEMEKISRKLAALGASPDSDQ